MVVHSVVANSAPKGDSYYLDRRIASVYTTGIISYLASNCPYISIAITICRLASNRVDFDAARG